MGGRIFASLLSLALVSWFQPAALADGLACPPPTSQTESNIKADLVGQAQTFLKLGGAELKGKVETAVQNLYEKYPSADRIVIIRDMMYTTCQLLNTSHSLNDEAKLQKWFEFLGIARTFLPADQGAGVGGKPNLSEEGRDQELTDSVISVPDPRINYILSLNNTVSEVIGNSHFRLEEMFYPEIAFVDGRSKKLKFDRYDDFITDGDLNGKYTIYDSEWSGPIVSLRVYVDFNGKLKKIVLSTCTNRNTIQKIYTMIYFRFTGSDPNITAKRIKPSDDTVYVSSVKDFKWFKLSLRGEYWEGISQKDDIPMPCPEDSEVAILAK
jgi:hypothetical protein